MKRVALVLNAQAAPCLPLPDDYFIVAVDGGYNSLPRCDLLIGDLDSLTGPVPTCPTLKFPPVKNESDAEIALRHIAAQGYLEVDLYCGEILRSDHHQVNLNLLFLAQTLGLTARIIRFVPPLTHIYLLTSVITLKCQVNDLISLVPVGGSVTIAQASGVNYPLDDLLIPLGSSRGLSNFATQSEVKITLKSGSAFVYHLLEA